MSCESQSGTATTTESEPEESPAADVAAEDRELAWNDITQLLKQKLTAKSFTETLRYLQKRQSVSACWTQVELQP